MSWSISAPTSTPTDSLPNVKICIAHNGKVSMEWAQVMLGPMQYVQVPTFDKNVVTMQGVKNLDTERNELAKVALSDLSTTHIMFVDTDIITEIPVLDAIAILLGRNVDIVSGLYRAKQKDGFPNAVWIKAKPDLIPPELRKEGVTAYSAIEKWDPPTANMLEADAVGAGFLLIKREVFEKIGFPWFVWDKPYPSEDFIFCEKLKKAGYKILVTPDVKCSHEGNVKIRSDGKIVMPEV